MADGTVNVVDLQPALMHNEEEEAAAADHQTPRGYCLGTKISDYFRRVLSPLPDPAVGSSHPIMVDLQPAMRNEEENCFGTKISEYGERLRTRTASYLRRVLSPRPDPALHPIMVMICEQELGKSVLSLGVPVAVALVINNNVNNNNKAVIVTSPTSALLGHLVVTGLSAGSMAIWNGIVLRRTFQRAALVMEQLGIIMVLVSFYGLVASALPVQLAWVPLLCAGLCLLPYFFLIPAAAPAAADVHRRIV